MKILVVEDNEDSRNLLMKQLRAYGHEATATADGVEALQQALAQPPDIIVSDILMPNMDGYQLCQECKQNDKLKDIPFVFYTATYTKEEDEKLALSLGANTFIRKPTEPDVLAQMLSEIVENAQSGALAPRKVAPLEPSLFLTEYTKRVVAKLEDKVTQLEMEITERKRIEYNLNERVKELRCLYGIANIAERQAITLDELYQEVANVLPSSWQYPEITCAKIAINGKEFKTENYRGRGSKWKQSSDINVYGAKVGEVEVNYLEERPELDEGPFLKEERLLIDAIAERLGGTTERMQAEHNLNERVKELQCLYGIANLAEKPAITLDEILKRAIDFILDAWQYPEIACSRVTLGGKEFKTGNFAVTEWKQSSDIKIESEKVGALEVYYLEEKPELDEGPFLKEERELIDGVARMLGDITERKRAEDEIKRAAEEWRTTFDSITDLVFITDKDFRLIRMNKAFADVVKKKPAELIGKPCYEIVHGTNKTLSNCPYKQTIKTKKPATAEFFEPHLGIHLEVATSPIFNEKGEVVASVHLVRDVTERKKMEEQLIVTDRLASIGELASGIAHEINNPLTGVIGFSDLLLDRDLPDDIKEDIEVINREAKRTAGVVGNLLTFARKHEVEKKPVDIHNIIQKVLELRAYEQKVSNIEVNTRFASDLPEVMADGFRLQQVFINIIINAEHFMTEAHRKGTLIITTERVGDIIRASFADDGPGIAKGNLGHLFDPFFTTKEVGKGTGLGLSISYGIITEHGGRIYAESELDKGATFVVELPITKQ